MEGCSAEEKAESGAFSQLWAAVDMLEKSVADIKASIDSMQLGSDSTNRAVMTLDDTTAALRGDVDQIQERVNHITQIVLSSDPPPDTPGRAELPPDSADNPAVEVRIAGIHNPMTDEQRTEYLLKRGSQCPYCNSVRIEEFDQEEDAEEPGTVVHFIECLSCKRNWEDYFDLTRVCDGTRGPN